MTTNDRERWDRRHDELATNSLGPPSACIGWLPAVAGRGPRPVALDLACGRGRNALGLAALGYRVVAVDVSRTALCRLRGADGVVRVQSDVDAWAFAGAAFDVLVQIDFLDRRALSDARDSVKPGGLFLLDTFAGAADPDLPGPRSSDHRLEYGELTAMFADWEVLRLEERPPPGGRATLLARRPTRFARVR